MYKVKPKEYFDLVYTGIRKAARYRNKSRKQKLQFINRIYIEIDKLFITLESQPQLDQPQCNGCNFCCYLNVDVTELEAISIVHYLKTALSYKELKDLKQRIKKTAEQVTNLDKDERVSAKIPCPLLADGKCSVYQCRPLSCRGYASLSVSQCQCGFGEPKVAIPLEPWRINVCGAVLTGLIDEGQDLQDLNVRLSQLLA